MTRAPTLAAILAAALAPTLAARAQSAPPAVRLAAAWPQSGPGAALVTATLGRGASLRSAGLAPWQNAVVVTDQADTTLWTLGTAESLRLRPRDPGSGPELTADNAGFAIGLDHRYTDDVAVGAALAHGSGGLHAGRAEAATEATSLALYALGNWPDIAYGSVALQYDFGDIALGDASAGAPARRQSAGLDTFRAAAAIGHLIDLPGFTIAPLVELRFAHGIGPATGPAAAAAADSLDTTLGLRVGSAFYRWGILGSPHVLLGWQRTLVAPDRLNPEGSDALVGGGLTLALPGGLFAGFDAEATFGGRRDARRVAIAVAYGF